MGRRGRDSEPGSHELWVDLTEEVAAASSAGREGVVRALVASDDLNANLVRFGAGRGVQEHVNDEVDVIFVGVSGSGVVQIDGEGHVLDAGKLLFVPKGARRWTRGVSRDFAYLTVHKRRGPIRVGRTEFSPPRRVVD